MTTESVPNPVDAVDRLTLSEAGTRFDSVFLFRLPTRIDGRYPVALYGTRDGSHIPIDVYRSASVARTAADATRLPVFDFTVAESTR